MPPPLRCSLLAASCSKQLLRPSQSSRSFSSTSRNERKLTRARRIMFQWLATKGKAFRDPLPNSTNYLGAYDANGQLKRVVDASRNNNGDDAGGSEQAESEGKTFGAKDQLPPEQPSDRMPFPLNKAFKSEPVLSFEFREEIWSRIMREGKSVRTVSAELGVEMSRVGAVVRLMEIEKEWIRIGKPLMSPYSSAVMSMLPKTAYPLRPGAVHESINDLPVHSFTGTQIFHPTSESRHFTRADAAKVFSEKLLPADDRVPHPELAELHKDKMAGLSSEERRERAQAMVDRELQKAQRAADLAAKKEAAIKKVETQRYQFRVTSINMDDAGPDGRGRKGVGWRYGMPHMDRSRGAVKIPTRVG